MSQQLLQKIQMIHNKTQTLSADFGKRINNPILKGVNINSLIQFTLKRHVFYSWEKWDYSVKNNNKYKMSQYKCQFRSAIVYIENTLTECMEGELNPEDRKIAEEIDKDLKLILCQLDAEDIGIETR